MGDRRERLEREFDLDLISTAPNVVYRVILEGRRPVIQGSS
jgi:GTP-binding protein LepA